MLFGMPDLGGFFLHPVQHNCKERIFNDSPGREPL